MPPIDVGLLYVIANRVEEDKDDLYDNVQSVWRLHGYIIETARLKMLKYFFLSSIVSFVD